MLKTNCVGYNTVDRDEFNLFEHIYTRGPITGNKNSGKALKTLEK
jgi:hypothetical protein